MKTSNQFLVYSFICMMAISIFAAIALRMQGNSDIHFYVAQDMQSTTYGDNTNQQNNNGAILTNDQANFSFTDFAKIEVAGNWEILLKRSDRYQVKVFADQKTLEEVVVDKHGDSLSFSMRSGWYGQATGKVRAEVSLPTLKSISSSGNSKITFAKFAGDNLLVEISGNSELGSQDNDFISAHINASGHNKITSEDDSFADLAIDISGNGRMIAKDSTITNLSFLSEGASKTDLLDSKVVNAHIDLSGASELKIKMNGGALKGEVSGASRVIYTGLVHGQEINLSGASRLIQMN